MDAKAAGVNGLIVVDLPPEEDTKLCVPALHSDMNFIRLATPTTDDKRLPAVLANTSGFVYYVSITGITGAPAILDRFDALGDMVKPGRIDPSWFYAGLVSLGSRDNRPVLIPVSFDLPAAVFFRPGMQAELSSMFMPLDTLRTLSQSFNAPRKTGGFSAMGFSPFWNQDFIDDTALLFGARFRPGRNGLPAWDQDGLNRTVDFARAWLAEVDGGASADDAFSSKNLVQPWYKLLSGEKDPFRPGSIHGLFRPPGGKAQGPGLSLALPGEHDPGE